MSLFLIPLVLVVQTAAYYLNPSTIKCRMIMRRSVIAVVALVSIVLLFSFVWRYLDFLYSPVFSSNEPPCLVVSPGDTGHSLITKIQQQGGELFPRFFLGYLRLSGQSRDLRAGRYCFSHSESSVDLIHRLVKGDVTVYPFVLVEGWTYAKLQQVIAKTVYITQSDDDQLPQLTLLGVPYQHPEGLLLPDTYAIRYGSSAKQVVDRAHKAMNTFLEKAWAERAPNLPYKSPYQALIAASIIEKESANAVDRVRIAGVIINRLHRRMFLQMDPTVIYGLHTSRLLTHRDLKKNTPYNSYRHIGLPPTPICMPSRSSIMAALHPAVTDYLYFVSRGDGTHQFSKTLSEQNQAVNYYIRHQSRSVS